MTSIFEDQTPQNKAFSNQNKGHLGSRYKPVEVHFLLSFWRLQKSSAKWQQLRLAGGRLPNMTGTH